MSMGNEKLNEYSKLRKNNNEGLQYVHSRRIKTEERQMSSLLLGGQTKFIQFIAALAIFH